MPTSWGLDRTNQRKPIKDTVDMAKKKSGEMKLLNGFKIWILEEIQELTIPLRGINRTLPDGDECFETGARHRGTGCKINSMRKQIDIR